MIDAWVAQGYSLRHQLVDVLIAIRIKDVQNNDCSEMLENIKRLNMHSKVTRVLPLL
jgi:hypothetical protein